MDIKILMGLVKREVRDEVEFSQVDKHKVSYHLTSRLLASKFPAKWYDHS